MVHGFALVTGVIMASSCGYFALLTGDAIKRGDREGAFIFLLIIALLISIGAPLLVGVPG